ncbi:MAG: DUF3102 domain-containing protein [Gemmatimonadales bacterium]
MKPVSQEVDIAKWNTLPDWSEPGSIEGAKEAILSLGYSMCEHAYLIGKHLVWVKAQVGHGDFLPWIGQNLRRFSERTAQNLMAFARQCDGAGVLEDYHPGKNATIADLEEKDGIEQVWADRINAESSRPARKIIEAGQVLCNALKDLGTQEWLRMFCDYKGPEPIEKPLRFSSKMGRKLMVIASDPVIGKLDPEPPGEGSILGAFMDALSSDEGAT